MEPYIIEMPPPEVVNTLVIVFGLVSVLRTVVDLLRCTLGSNEQVLNKLEDLSNEVKELKEIVDANQKTDLLTVVDSSGAVVLGSEDNEITEEQTDIPESTPESDKHAILRTKLTPNQELFVSYKKTTFLAKFILKESAPHGYVLMHNNTEYVTPSQFSFKLKKTLNPTISSDNGWDTVYIITGQNEKGKPIKKSLKELVA